MFTIQSRSFIAAHDRCIERFSDSTLVTGLLNAVKKMCLDEKFRRGNYEFIISDDIAFGIRVLANNVLAMMIRIAINQSTSAAFAKVPYVLISGEIDGLHYGQKEARRYFEGLKDDEIYKRLEEPAIKEWAEALQVPFSTKVNINALFYTNNRMSHLDEHVSRFVEQS